MAIDGLTLAAVTHELKSIAGARVEKIYQPERDELIIGLRSSGESRRLLISASAENYRLHLTSAVRTNPTEPPVFCMLLRKRLIGGRILKTEQQGLDRVVHISVEAYDDFGELGVYTLIAELTGRHSNIVLVDKNGIILDSIKHIGPGVSSVRTVLPGMQYKAVPPQRKIDPRRASAADFAAVLFAGGTPEKKLSEAFSGLSPNMAKALIDCAAERSIDAKKQGNYLESFYSRIQNGDFEPTLVLDEFDDIIGVYPFRPEGFAKTRQALSMSEAMDEFYAKRDLRESIKRKSAALSRVISGNIERLKKKLALYDEAISGEDIIQRHRLYGELITANLHAIKKGAGEAALFDYCAEPPAHVIVPLDERLSPSENAKMYFKRYKKAKAARVMAEKQKANALEELLYLEGQADNLTKCTTDAELFELREEMICEGFIKPDRQKQKAKQASPSRPMHFVSGDGFDIYAGKNNRQNDELTLKTAESNDIFLHTKDIPGSHVIIRRGGRDVPQETLREAAHIAAWYSKAKGSAQVPVDYTLRRFIKKPSGARPGTVIYTNQSTLYITPDERVINGLRRPD